MFRLKFCDMHLYVDISCATLVSALASFHTGFIGVFFVVRRMGDFSHHDCLINEMF